ncbi:MAG: hypothetical protein KJN92_07995, partial [Gemmatimonadetes bacterium]|nr:hypothetical protein [Gemmatimonadota bacterium]
AILSGVFSVHTGRSHDARGTREQVAEAASEAALDFVVIGDHPPDVRRPDWAIWDPAFFGEVFIDGGLELRAPVAGKVLTMGVDSAYKRWQGDLESFVEFLDEQDVTSMVVHGRGPRGSERWVHDGVEGLQGWEVLDISEFSRARIRGPWALYHLVLSVVGFPFGLADESMIHFMREGFETGTVAAYDSLRQAGPLTATAGLNVHPKLGLGPVLVPSYDPFFRTLVSHVAVAEPLPSDPAMAQRLLAEGVRRGDVFISLGDQEGAEGFRLAAVLEDGRQLPMGTHASFSAGATLRAGLEEPSGQNLAYRILRDGEEVEWVLGPSLEWEIQRPGVYRVEVHRFGLRLGKVFFRLRPWIFANPIGLVVDPGTPGPGGR